MKVKYLLHDFKHEFLSIVESDIKEEITKKVTQRGLFTLSVDETKGITIVMAV